MITCYKLLEPRQASEQLLEAIIAEVLVVGARCCSEASKEHSYNKRGRQQQQQQQQQQQRANELLFDGDLRCESPLKVFELGNHGWA